jgi:hypothetical protein
MQYSLGYVLKLLCKSKEFQNCDSNFEKYLSIALRQYVLPELDANANGLKPKQFAAYCISLPIGQIKNALEVFDRKTTVLIEQGQLSEATKNNYRSSLKRFLDWLPQQVWWGEADPYVATNKDVAPFRVKLAQKPTKGKQPTYGLTKNKLPQDFQEEMDAFHRFRLTGGQNTRRSWQERRRDGEQRTRKPRMVAVKPTSCRREEQAILRFFGWYTKEYSDQELHLELLTYVDLLDDYVYWVTEVRGVSHSTAVHMTRVAVSIAKWLNYHKSIRRNWIDIPIVLELQDLEREYAEIYEQEKKQHEAEKWEQKKLTHQAARQVVQYSQRLCAPNYGRHDKETGEFLSHGTRSTSAVARAWQTYLFVKILVYCPVRQEELRNFKLGETLFRKEDELGNPYYIVKLKEHKRSLTTRKARHYRLPSILTEDLDLWIYKWRPLIVESVKTLDSWMDFWGYGGQKVDRIKSRLEAAKQGTVSERVTNSIDQYIEQENIRLQGAENRAAAWESAKENVGGHNHLFFLLSKHEPESFGKPHYVASVWRLVNRAIARATKTLFGEERWTNPHALRHIAEAHIRRNGKSHIAEAFGTFIGHSKEMGDEYAEQVISEYDLTKDIVDDWWE